ncbi:MAG: hypothetical protein IMW92_12120 [Bacillales bacterium]|nr:hypothetical protein [Bacillales bacterium]
MIIVHDFGYGLKEYASRGKMNEFPLFEKCLNCHAFGQMHRHGFYFRYAITKEESNRIPICRLKCLACKKTFSILPDFLIPYFQHTTLTILERLQQFLVEKKTSGSRQLLAFHLRRYLKGLKWVHSFFINLGNVWGFSNNIKNEAVTYIKRILDLGETQFFRRSWGYLSSYFMAK